MGADCIAGAIVIPVNNALLTDRVAADEVMPLTEAVTLVLPNATPLAIPAVLVPLIVATPVLADIQLT